MSMTRFAFLVGLAVTCFSSLGLAQDRTTLIKEGGELFFKQGCFGCHTVGNVGTPISPDLTHVGAQYALPYLTGWLRDPASQKHSAHMPRIELTAQEIHALAAYLSSLR
jgi:cytochrome c oxidase subunit II